MTVAVVLGVAFLGPYGWALSRARRPWPAWRAACYVAGVAVIVVAVGPLDGAADSHLPDHMVQHLLVGTLAPPLVALGAPIRLALAALRSRGRHRVGALLQSPPSRIATYAPVAFGLAAVNMLAWNLPPLFNLASDHEAIHLVEHAALFWSALLMWTVVLGGAPLPRRPDGLALLAGLMAAMIPDPLIGSIYGSTSAPLFAHYAQGAHALADQQTAGTVMWAGGTAIMAPATIALVILAVWREEQRQRRREAAAGVLR